MRFAVYSILASLILLGACTDRSKSSADLVSADSITQLLGLSKLNKIGNNRLARVYALRALKLAEKTSDYQGMIKACEAMGTACWYGDVDSAYIFYDQALKIAVQHGLESDMPELLYNAAQVHIFAHNYSMALKLLDSAALLAKKKDQYEVWANVLNSLGNVYYDAGNHPQSKKLYDSSYHVSFAYKLKLQAGTALGNRVKFIPPDSAIPVLKECIRILTPVRGAEEELASFYANLAGLYEEPDSGIFYSQKALAITEKARLPEVEIGAFNNMAYSYLSKNEIRLAEACIRDNALPIAEKYNNLDWLASIYDTYADVLSAKGEFRKALEFEKMALTTREKAGLQYASKQVRALSAVLELKRKDEQLKERQAEVNSKQLHIYILLSGIVVLVLLIAGIVVLYSRRLLKNRLKLITMSADSTRRLIALEEQENKRLAEEIHHIAGPVLLFLNSQLEEMQNSADPDAITYINSLKTVSERLRSLSHRMSPALRKDIGINELVRNLTNDLQLLSEVSIEVLLPASEPQLPSDLLNHTYRIIQELLINGIKYVKSGNIDLKISVEEGFLYIFYTDNGQGFNFEDEKDKGLGLSNIIERSRFLGGDADLRTKAGQGVNWIIHIPLEGKNA